ncbi:MAG: DUF3034 family protein [Proteobacteria bacterium]|nr:DUF3034 family protein [Pseudomonadota bacterium]MBU1647909.1 DUF3034 family protein [Pseudomonadota bacterium]
MKKEVTGLLIGGVFVLGAGSSVFAGPPLTNVEGVGGVALNPLAYVANPIGKDETGLFGNTIVSKPNIGAWHISLPDSDINWEAAGVNISFFNRLEIGYSHESVDIDNYAATPGTIDKDNVSAKLNLLAENSFDMAFLPAISVGVIHKSTNFNTLVDLNLLNDNSGEDYYAVATKTLTMLPVPVILNAGVLSTKGYVRGVLGFGDDRDEAFFGNIETIPIENVIVGWEYAGGTDVATGFSTHSMWEAHVAWMINDLTLVASYADTGAENITSTFPPTSFGDGWVISAQYAF